MSVLPPIVLSALALLSGGAALSAQDHLYRVIGLGHVPGQSAIAGVIAHEASPDAEFVCGTSIWEGYRWSRRGGMEALPKPPGESIISPESINRFGDAVGKSGLTASGSRALWWPRGGGVVSLHQPSWSWSRAARINASGRVLAVASLGGNAQAFLGTTSGNFVPLAPGATFSSPIDLNDRGDVLYNDPNDYLLRDRTGNVTPLPGPYVPFALGENGQIGGLSNGTAAVWTEGAGWNPLFAPLLNMRRMGGVNAFGQVAASHSVQYQTSPPRFDYFGYIYTEGVGWTELNALVDPAAFVDVETVVGISDDGKITAYGSIGPDNRPMLLEPRFFSTYGQGCANAARNTPKAFVGGDPRPGQRIAFVGAHDRPFAQGAMLVALGRGRTAVPGGCDLLVDPSTLVVLPTVANAAGQVSAPLDLPTTFPSIPLFAQYLALDPTAPNGVFALSNGVRVAVQ